MIQALKIVRLVCINCGWYATATMTILQAFKTHCSLLAVLKVEFLTYSRTSGYLEV